MKLVTTTARLLLGLIFLVFGSNMFLHFISLGPMPTGTAGQFMGALFVSHDLYVVGGLMVLAGILLLANLFVPLALIFLGPILVNILLYHVLMHPEGIALGLLSTALWFLVFARHFPAFRGLLQARTAD